MTATHTFTYKGTEYTVPAFASLPIGVLRKARKAKDEMDMTFTILEMTIGEDSPEIAVIDTMSTTEFETFLSGWTQGAPVGEA